MAQNNQPLAFQVHPIWVRVPSLKADRLRMSGIAKGNYLLLKVPPDDHPSNMLKESRAANVVRTNYRKGFGQQAHQVFDAWILRQRLPAARNASGKDPTCLRHATGQLDAPGSGNLLAEKATYLILPPSATAQNLHAGPNNRS